MHASLHIDPDRIHDEADLREELGHMLAEHRAEARTLDPRAQAVAHARIDLACALLPFLRGAALAAVYGQFYRPPTTSPRDRASGAASPAPAVSSEPG